MRMGTDDDNAAIMRQYLKDNRAVWKALGVRNMTAPVHDDDRELVATELEVRKWYRMVTISEDDNTPLEHVKLLSARNMARFTSQTDRDSGNVESRMENSTDKKDIQHCLEQYRYYRRKYNGVRSQYDPEAPTPILLRAEAKAVAYSNLSVAYLRQAVVRLEVAPKATVFGKQHDSTPVGDKGDNDA